MDRKATGFVLPHKEIEQQGAEEVFRKEKMAEEIESCSVVLLKAIPICPP